MRSSSATILYVNLDRELEWSDDIETQEEFLEVMPLVTMCKHTLCGRVCDTNHPQCAKFSMFEIDLCRCGSR